MKSLVCMLLFVLVVFSSCKQEKDEIEALPPEKLQVITEVGHTEKIECYGYALNRDTIYMALHIKDDSLVMGSLSYSLYKKDQRKGNLRGKLKNDSLFADYNYDSKGENSTREVFFLHTDAGFVEGNTNTEVKNDKIVFTDRKFKLNDNYMLKRTDCR